MGRKRTVGKHYQENPKIRSLRIRTWFQATARASGLTAAELERRFAQGVGGERRSCIWDKYRRGEIEPTSDVGKNGLVERVEQAYPGTAIWLSSAIWRLADPAPIEMTDVRKIYEEIQHRLIRSIFVAVEDEAGGKFWRRPISTEGALDYLLRFGNLDALIALLALIREAEIAQLQSRHEKTIDAAKLFIAQYCLTGKIMPSAAAKELAEHLFACWQNPGYFTFDETEESLDESEEDDA